MTFSTWEQFFLQEQQKPYWSTWMQFLDEEYAHHVVYPPRHLMFSAFEQTPLSTIKVVILGQDPYHQPLQAHGLSFSVPKDISLPRSLRNIYREIEDDLGVSMNHHSGDLSYLAKQGVLLLNTVLTVRHGEPLSHQQAFYETFFEAVMHRLNALDQSLVMMLWGKKANRYASWFDGHRHLMIHTNHPSPLSANRGGWFKTKPFSRANQFLIDRGRTPIRWVNQ